MNRIVKNMLLSLVFFTLGFLATSFQIILLRELLVVFSGNEILLSLAFFWWFFSIGLGAYFSKIVPANINKYLFFIFLLIILSILPSHQIFIVRSSRFILNIPPGEWIPFVKTFLYTFLVCAPFSFILGVIFPYAVSVANTELSSKGQDSKKAGFVYYLESFGSTAAGIIISLILLAHFSHDSILVFTVVSFLVFSTAVCLFLLKGKTGILTATVIVILTLALIKLSPTLSAASIELRWKGISTFKKVAEVDSIHQNITTGEEQGQHSIFSNGNYVASFPDVYSAEFDSHFLAGLHPNPKSILLMGDGREEMIEHLLQYGPTSVELVQLDEKIHEQIVQFLPQNSINALKDKRVNLEFIDPRAYAKERALFGPGYDLVISLPGDPVTLSLNRFFTREFFTDIKATLKEGGIFITSVSSSENYLQGDMGRYLGSIYKTARAVFKGVSVIPGTKAYVVCSKSAEDLSLDPEIVSERFRGRSINAKHFNEYDFRNILQKSRIETAASVLVKNYPLYIVNEDLHPGTFLLSLRVLGESSGSIANKILGFVEKISLFYLLIILINLMMLGLAFILLGKKNGSKDRFNILLTISTTGFIGFASELILIYMFQARFGHIYQSIGLIIGCFMLGLSIGSILGNGILPKIRPGSFKVLMIFEVLILICAFSIPFAVTYSPSPFLFYLFAGIFGFLTGFEFPLANKAYLERSNLFKAASLIDSLDHFGAAFAALLCGLVLIPVLGIIQTCVFLVAMKAVCIVLWLSKGLRQTSI